MSDFYTSYATSVALRDAGAPQVGKFATYWCDGFMLPSVHSHCTLTHNGAAVTVYHPRAFRADEILEAIAERIGMLTPFKSGRWACRIKPASVPPGWVDDYFGDSLVEALAVAWLAVLKEARHE